MCKYRGGKRFWGLMRCPRICFINGLSNCKLCCVHYGSSTTVEWLKAQTHCLYMAHLLFRLPVLFTSLWGSSWVWVGSYVSGLRSLVFKWNRSSTLDMFANLLNPTAGEISMCCTSPKLVTKVQTKALDLFCHLWGIALFFWWMINALFLPCTSHLNIMDLKSFSKVTPTQSSISHVWHIHIWEKAV